MTLEDSVRRHRVAILQRAAVLDNVTQACREAGISRTLFYRWRRRYLRYGADGLRPRPSRPTRWPRQAIPALEHQVLAYALLWPTHGPARIAVQLRQPLWGGWHKRAGYRIQAVLTDGGPEWQVRFVAACRELGITHRRTKPRHAWTNGFVERLQGTILTEL